MRHTPFPFVLISLVALIGLLAGCDNAFLPTQSDVAAGQSDKEPADAASQAIDSPADSVQWNGHPWDGIPPDSIQWYGDPWDCDPPGEQDTVYHDPEPWVPNWPDTI